MPGAIVFFQIPRRIRILRRLVYIKVHSLQRFSSLRVLLRRDPSLRVTCTSSERRKEISKTYRIDYVRAYACCFVSAFSYELCVRKEI